MVVDIPNLYTLPIELGVAFMILIIDKRSRKREQESIVRGQELERRQREAQKIQMERFSAWIQENSKRQVMLLESIMGALGADHKDAFAKEVSTRYRNEISRDIEELEDLLEKRESLKDDLDPFLDNEIDSKIDEIESAQEIASSFLPPNLVESIKSVSRTAKESFVNLQKLRDLENINLGDIDNPSFEIKIKDKEQGEDPLKEFHQEKEKLSKEMENLRAEIQHTIAEQTAQIGTKIANLFSPKGIKDLINREKEDKDDEEED